jgi:hypothetical protein
MPAENKTKHGFLTWADEHSLGLLIFACFLAFAVWEMFDLFLNPQYPIADFLINYSQGFVRRGLPGEIILLLARVAHMPPPWMTVVMQTAVYACLLRGIYVLAKPLRRDMIWYAMLFSPATLPLMILVPGNAVRKEMLLHIALVATIFLVQRKTKALTLSFAVAAMFAALVLSHETLGCCFPYFVAAIAIGYSSVRSAIKITAVPFVIAGVLEVLVRRHMGTLPMAIGICKSVGGKWVGANDSYNLCAGAIGHLTWTPAMYRAEELANLHYWPYYSLLYVMAMAPLVAAIVVLYRRDHLRFDAKVIACTAVVCAFASLPLFYFAIDWGRWIWMQTICLLLVVLMAAQRARGFQANAITPAIGQGKPWRKVALAATFLYCFGWTMPVLGMQEMRFGYLALIPAEYHEVQLRRHFLHYDQIDRGF